MKKKRTKADENLDLSAEAVRNWSLAKLMELAEASLDISRCGDADYLQGLDAQQINKVKRVVYGRNGNIVSIEPLSVVDIIVAAANIAGTREAAKQTALAEATQKKSSIRSNKLELNVNSPAAAKDEKSKGGKKPDTLNGLLDNIKS